MTRRSAVVKVQIARRDLRLDDATYRAMLERLTGRTSSADCTDAQLGRVLDEMKAKGWKAYPGGRGRRPSGTSRPDAARPGAARSSGSAVSTRRAASNPVARKARAMWISLHQLGEVRDPSEAALEAFGRRQLGVERLEWVNQSQGYRLIEALKAMAERGGWSQTMPAGSDAVRTLKINLIIAQCRKLRVSPRQIVLGLQKESDCAPGAYDEDEARRWSEVSIDYLDRCIKDLASDLVGRAG